MQECIFRKTEVRSQQAHNLWHRALDSYSYPDEFHTILNALIQSLRSITFVLQKEGSHIQDFNNWYSKKRDEMRSDPLLRWLVEKRNQVEKEGDLDTLSTAEIHLIDSWYDRPSLTLTANPTDSNIAIAEAIATKLGDDIAKYGVLRIERRWTLQELQGRDILDALSECYFKLTSIIEEAHSISHPGRSYCVSSKSYKPPECMEVAASQRAFIYHIRDKSELQHRRIFEKPKLYKTEEVQKRYGPMQSFDADPFEKLELVLEMAKKVLQKDKYHIPLVILSLPNKEIMPIVLYMEDQQGKFILWRDIGETVRKTSANALIFITESWIAPREKGETLKPVGESPNRREALTVTKVTSKGEKNAWLLFSSEKTKRLSLNLQLNLLTLLSTTYYQFLMLSS